MEGVYFFYLLIFCIKIYGFIRQFYLSTVDTVTRGFYGPRHPQSHLRRSYLRSKLPSQGPSPSQADSRPDRRHGSPHNSSQIGTGTVLVLGVVLKVQGLIQPY